MRLSTFEINFSSKVEKLSLRNSQFYFTFGLWQLPKFLPFKPFCSTFSHELPVEIIEKLVRTKRGPPMHVVEMVILYSSVIKARLPFSGWIKIYLNKHLSYLYAHHYESTFVDRVMNENKNHWQFDDVLMCDIYVHISRIHSHWTLFERMNHAILRKNYNHFNQGNGKRVSVFLKNYKILERSSSVLLSSSWSYIRVLSNDRKEYKRRVRN